MSNNKSVGGRRGPHNISGALSALVSVCSIVALGLAFTITRGATDPVKPPYIQFIGHTADLTDAEYSADGKRVLTASSDKTARIWNAANGVSLITLSGHTAAVR
ncbi:MAG TPA: hypothetical protein VGB93_07590, partial [Methylovirgula sp.]